MVDILGWHAGRRALLVIELKTEIVDVNELLGTLDRKRRLAREIGLERGWDAVTVSAYLIIRDSRTNRRRVQAHAVMLGAAMPDGRRSVRAWLSDPIGSIAGLTFWTDSRGMAARQAVRPIRRVRVADRAQAERGWRT